MGPLVKEWLPENTRPHNSKRSVQWINDSKRKRMPHPPYSPDIAPSGVYLFENVRQRLQIYQSRSFEELQENVRDSGFYRTATIRAWIERLQSVIDTNREYV
jgi:hypothetical protein